MVYRCPACGRGQNQSPIDISGVGDLLWVCRYCKHEWTAAMRYEVTHAERSPAPEMEQTAYNQKPKDNGWSELRLMRYDGTDLYQWWGRRRMLNTGPGEPVDYVWEDPCDAPFCITAIGGHDDA